MIDKDWQEIFKKFVQEGKGFNKEAKFNFNIDNLRSKELILIDEFEKFPKNHIPFTPLKFDPWLLLSWAIAANDVSGIENALKQGADINHSYEGDGSTPLILAVKNKRPEIVSFIMSQGANIFAKNNAGETALSFAKRLDSGEFHEVISLLEEAERAVLCQKLRRAMPVPKLLLSR